MFSEQLYRRISLMTTSMNSDINLEKWNEISFDRDQNITIYCHLFFFALEQVIFFALDLNLTRAIIRSHSKLEKK